MIAGLPNIIVPGARFRGNTRHRIVRCDSPGWSLGRPGAPNSHDQPDRDRPGRLALDPCPGPGLETTVDELLIDDEAEDVVIRPTKDSVQGSTYWMLTRPDDPSGRTVAKIRLPARKKPPEPKVHPGRDWFYVIEGAVLLRLGGKDHIVRAGQAAEFDTMTPHSMAGFEGPAEIITIFDHHGERTHLRE